ncbi:MAG: phage tail assembly chaperone [Sodalis sp. (in: enterobacteria)]|uniref:phage tail assembly chaperone n=1 Tax=Sodalis sp. (in: enterobacteria) TaxID=1898979 RepID=UPI0039E5B8F2
MDIELNGNTYRAGKLSVFDQLKVARKLLPVLSGMVGELQKLRGGEVAMETLLPALATAIGDIQDSDCDAIIHACLSVVSRQNGKAWMAVFRQGDLMFDDIDLGTLLQLVAQVIGDSLGNFFHAPLDGATVPPQPA